MSVIDAGRELRTRMWKTRGSRFVARGRLRRTNILSVTTITLLSTYVIFVSIVLLAFSGELYSVNEKWLNIINIGLSLLVIVFSLLEFSRDYLGQAEAMNQSALKIGEIYSDLSAKVDSGSLTQADLEAIERRYSDCLQQLPANHDPIDYFLFQVEHPKDFSGWWSGREFLRWIAMCFIFVKSSWLYWLGILAFPVLAVIFGEKFLILSN